MKFGNRFIGIGYQCAIAGLAVVALSAGFASRAIADVVVVDDPEYRDFPTVSGVRYGQIQKEFDNAFWGHDRDYYTNRTFTGQLKWMFGPFPENSMNKDGKEINKLYREMMYQQTNTGPVVRTLDLPSPFRSSLRTLPPTVVAVPIEVVQPGIIPVVPSVVRPPTEQQAPQKPVPGLW
jgi:hypothetical protein